MEMTTHETELLAANAALEAEVMRLREALTACVCAMQDYQAGIGITEMFDKGELLGRKALSTQFTLTALNELIEKVEKMTIERCAIAAWTHYAAACQLKGVNPHDSFLGAWISSSEIRTLPTGQIKLEELL